MFRCYQKILGDGVVTYIFINENLNLFSIIPRLGWYSQSLSIPSHITANTPTMKAVLYHTVLLQQFPKYNS